MIKHKHQQLFDLLRGELRSGTWPCGVKLPNLKELAAQYGVSINVASKAVELLKEADLVSAKVGGGIYSKTSGLASLVEFKYSGDRLFGQYGEAKQIHVLVEDNQEWQFIFWNAFFDRITRENPDIELQVRYNTSPSNHAFDLGLGSPEFLARAGFTPENAMPASVMNEFYGDAYAGLLLKPESLQWGSVSCYFPYGFINYYLLTAGDFPGPGPEEGVLDYIERIAGSSGRPAGYGIHSCRSLLNNSGLCFLDRGRRKPVIPASREILAVFERIRKLYRARHLIWPHGRFSDYDQIYSMAENQPIRIAEYAFNRGSRAEREKLAARGLSLLRHPAGEHPVIIPEAAAVNRRSYFAEECLRIILKLLDLGSQQQARKHCIFQPLHPELLEDESELISQVQSRHPADPTVPDPDLSKAFHYFINWELFYYLNGRRGADVCDFIHKKIDYYMKAKEGPS